MSAPVFSVDCCLLCVPCHANWLQMSSYDVNPVQSRPSGSSSSAWVHLSFSFVACFGILSFSMLSTWCTEKEFSCSWMLIGWCVYAQDYDAMVSLVEEMDQESSGRLTSSVSVQYWYSFALNRCVRLCSKVTYALRNSSVLTVDYPFYYSM